MTVDEAVRDLLAVSADIRRVAVIAEDGEVAGAAPGADAAAHVAGDTSGRCGEVAELEHAVVDLGDATVIMVAAGGRRIVAVTAPGAVLGLALFDLRTCLADAFPEGGTA